MKLEYWAAIGIAILLAVTTAMFRLIGGLSEELAVSANAFTSQFDARGNKFAFIHSKNKTTSSLVIYDALSDVVNTIESNETTLVSPRFSRDGKYIYFATTPSRSRILNLNDLKDEQKLSKIKRCALNDGDCVEILEFPGRVNSIVELDDGSLLFAAGLPEISADPFSPNDTFLGFRRYDFYLAKANQSNFRKVSDFDANLLSSASASVHTVAFDMLPRLKAQEKNNENVSDIFLSNLNINSNEKKYITAIRPAPFIHGDRLNISPDISEGGKYIVFRSARSSASGYIYDFVIVDMASEAVKTVINVSERANADTVSRPIIFDTGEVSYMKKNGSNYEFWRIDPEEGQKNMLGSLQIISLKN